MRLFLKSRDVLYLPLLIYQLRNSRTYILLYVFCAYLNADVIGHDLGGGQSP